MTMETDSVNESNCSPTKRRFPVPRSFSSPAKIEEEKGSPRHQPMRSSSSLEVMLDERLLLGLSIAGVAWSLLTSTFGMFHVDLFLRAYQLPLQMYSVGNIVITIINTFAHLLGAWIVDHMDGNRARSELTGLSGCVFTLCFLAPFFRWKEASEYWNGVHYIVSLALYYTLFAFTSILMASVVNDNHHMSDHYRIAYMASGKVANFVASFAATRVGLALFDTTRLYHFRIFLLVLTGAAALLYALAQFLITSDNLHNHPRQQRSGYSSADKSKPWLWSFVLPRRKKHLHADTDLQPLNVNENSHASQAPIKPLQLRQVARDFWKHDNFKAWIGMELLLEAQTTFASFFLKTFVDGLLLDTILDRASCDWLLSMIRPMTDMLSILVYLPIRRFGYHRVYQQVFYLNIMLSVLLLYVARAETTKGSSSWLLFFICVYPTFTGAVMSAGFHLAQADMVLEMKRNHALEGRHNEPSLAALFIGANALFCKPAESILPVTAANVLVFSNHISNVGSTRESLFYLLVVPPLVCSCLQILVWRNYDLTPLRTSRLRDELHRLRASHGSNQKVIMDVI